MAYLDEANKAVVLRIVYSGPPMAGKTATLTALSGLLLGTRASAALFSPDEAHGRTLYFDWLEYEGGLFQGRKIRCQVVSVPGQKALEARRRLILEGADVVVYVLDSHCEQLPEAAEYLAELHTHLARPEDEPPVPIVLQANKTDLPNALSGNEIKQGLGDAANMTVVPSVAPEGRGVREAFVLSVGLALARVRELIDADAVPIGSPEIASGEDLLKRIRQDEQQEHGYASGAHIGSPSALNAVDSLPVSLTRPQLSVILRESLDLEAAVQSGQEAAAEGQPAGTPRVPGRNPKAGSLWPTVGGRIILHELADRPVQLARHADESWTGVIDDRWRLLSLPEHVYADEPQARDAMLDLARRHIALKPVLSEHRCIVYSDSGFGDFRIWQILRKERALADAVAAAARADTAESFAAEVFEIAVFLVKAITAFGEQPPELQATLSSVTSIMGRPVFAGFVADRRPDFDLGEPARAGPASIISEQFREPVQRTMAERGFTAPALLRQIERVKRNHASAEDVAAALSLVVIGH
jgi:signal recognition particle receptor subunit beta